MRDRKCLPDAVVADKPHYSNRANHRPWPSHEVLENRIDRPHLCFESACNPKLGGTRKSDGLRIPAAECRSRSSRSLDPELQGGAR
jgi:hypothetical protein